MHPIARALLTLVLQLPWAAGGALAQPTTPAPTATPVPAAAPVTPALAHYLIRSTLLTFNDANRSGNYTVLRDLAAPDFQARHAAADIGQSFLDLRRRNFDLYGAALLAPQFTAPAALDQRGRLRLAGYIPTRPQQIGFDLTFQSRPGSGGSSGLPSPRRRLRPRHEHAIRRHDPSPGRPVPRRLRTPGPRRRAPGDAPQDLGAGLSASVMPAMATAIPRISSPDGHSPSSSVLVTAVTAGTSGRNSAARAAPRIALALA